MATESRRSDPSLSETLSKEPERFDLVQAVRVLERAAGVAANDPKVYKAGRIGGDTDPRAEAVQLRAALELAFPASEIVGYDDSGSRPALMVAAMGLNGPSGVLPAYYSEMVQDAQRDKNPAMRDFLDMFNHRAMSLFVRAADKYRIAMGFENSAGDTPDAVSNALYALVGLGEPSLRGLQAAPDTAMAFYAGHYAHQPRTAEALGQILSDFFERPARILQFQGRWSDLPPQEQTSLSLGAGNYSCLGRDAVCGSRVFEVQSAFRIVLGPLDYDQFMAFLPGTPQMAELIALARSYVGPAFSFDIQLILKASQIPPMALSKDPAVGGLLGRNTWMPTVGSRADAVDAVFDADAM